MSVFKCNVTYKKISGDSFVSTRNKLISQGFVDKFWNIKTDVATWRKGRSELNEQASALLNTPVNLFAEKKLLNGIRAVPDMKLFGMIDAINKKNSIEKINNTTQEESPAQVYNSIYEVLDIPEGNIPESLKHKAEAYINNFNKLLTGKTLSLVAFGGEYMVKSEYQYNYLFNVPHKELNIEEEKFPEEESNNIFNKNCI